MSLSLPLRQIPRYTQRRRRNGGIHVVGVTLRDQMEHLAEVQGVLALINLVEWRVSLVRNKDIIGYHTTKSPVTLTMRLAIVGEDGWASIVVTLCSTLLKGNN
jgi:hypothetical protein